MFKPLTEKAKGLVGMREDCPVIFRYPRHGDISVFIESMGIIPTFVSPYDNRSAIEQLNEGYTHGGGWIPFEGFEIDQTEDGWFTLQYPDDPMYIERGRLMLPARGETPDELIVIFPHAWVMVVTAPFSEEAKTSICRMD